MRVKLRIIHHCALLVTDGYKESFEFSNDKIYSRYMYGGAKSDDTDKTASVNYTYQYEQRSLSQLTFENFTSASSEYSLGTPRAFSSNKSFYNEVSTFFPLEELYDVDGDTLLCFLSANNILSIGEVDDPWFSAHQPFHQSETSVFGTGEEHYFLSDEPAAVLGCKVQYQVYGVQAPPTQNYSSWGGMYDLDPHAPYRNKPDKVDKPSQVLSWIYGSLSSPDDIVGFLKSSSLLAKANTSGSYQYALPDNQWQLEVENWHNIMLAVLQGSLVNSAIGPNDERTLENFWRRPDSETTRYLCQIQKIKSTAYSNFSVLGLVIVFVLGSLIVILDLTLESVIIFVESRRGTLKYSRLEWFTNGVLETQRLAHEELGLGTWEGCAGAGAVPVTRKGEFLAVLDISDPEHPRLKAAEGKTVQGQLDVDADMQITRVKRGSQQTPAENLNANTENSNTDIENSNTDLENPKTDKKNSNTHIENFNADIENPNIDNKILNTDIENLNADTGKTTPVNSGSQQTQGNLSTDTANTTSINANKSQTQGNLSTDTASTTSSNANKSQTPGHLRTEAADTLPMMRPEETAASAGSPPADEHHPPVQTLRGTATGPTTNKGSAQTVSLVS